MKWLSWLLVFLLCLSLVSGETYYNKDSLDLNLRMSSDIVVVPKASSYSLSTVETKLSLYPKDHFQQKVLELKTSPVASEKEGDLIYTWLKPEGTKLTYSLEAKIKVFDNVHKVKNKIKFPIENLPGEFLKYTKPGDKIDSDNIKVRNQASALAEGEDDLYVVVHKIATWVEENTNYDLSTLTVKSSQKASWVLEHRRGVCDEMTSLIVAMYRSLGIPARFVSGVSYSNDPQFETPWQAHGWAEVYFPEHGWIPFDVTFDEYGYVDPTHIKLQESFDAGEATTKFSWSGNQVDLEVKELDIDVDFLAIGKERLGEVDLDIEVLEKEIGFGSYNLVKVEIENLKNYYVAKTLNLVSTEEVKIEESRRHVLLKPGERKTMYWVMGLVDTLKSRYMYTFPVEVQTEKNTNAKTVFDSEKSAIVFSENEIEKRLAGLVEEEEKILSKDVEVNCAIAEKSVGIGEKSEVRCRIKNKGNVILRRLEVCLDSKCEKVDLNINEEKKILGEVEGKEIGEQRFLVSVRNQEVSKSVDVGYAVLDKSLIEIGEIEHPTEVDYGETFKISFVLEKKSFRNPTEARIKLFHEGYPNEWFVKELSENKKIEVDFSGSDFGFGENEFEILVEWEDETGEYNTRENFSIKLGEVSLGEKIAVIFKTINRFFLKLVK